jgi:hypothetical protein
LQSLCGLQGIQKAPKEVWQTTAPPKEPECIPWHTLCIDLIGPYSFGKGKDKFHLQCLTMIDPATGGFEIVEVPKRRADYVSNLIEINWLTPYPWPTKIIMDRGSKFAAEVRKMLNKEYLIKRKLITTRNPQANAGIERIHQVVGVFIGLETHYFQE